MSVTKKAGQIVREVTENVKRATYGKACVAMGHSTLSRGAAAGVTPSQLRSMFPDLQGFSDVKIEGFIEIGDGLVDGSIKIPSLIFGESKWSEAATE